MKKVTIKDIAKHCGVSITTVSWVLNGKTTELSAETVEKVKKAVKELGYHRNEIARSLVTSESKTFAIIIPDITNLFYASIVKAANKIAMLNGYSILLFDTNNSLEDEMRQINILDNRQIDGLIIASRNAKQVLAAFDNNRSVPIVVIDERIEVNNKNIQVVNTDNTEAARKLTNYVIRHGHERLFVLGGLKDSTNTKDRLDGFNRAIEDNDLDRTNLHLEYADYQMEKAYEIVKETFTTKYSAIIAFNDMMAYGAMKALNEMGIKDISVAAFDANPTLNMFNQLTNNDLTSINQDEKIVGEIATKELIKRLKNKKNHKENNVITIPSTLHTGDTVKQYSEIDSI